MPPLLADSYWADADREPIDTVARRLATSIDAQLGGAGEGDAAKLAAEAEATVGSPAHAKVIGDASVAQIEAVAQAAWDVFDAWDGVWTRGGNASDLAAPQRRLRWAVDLLGEEAAAALPLVNALARPEGEDLLKDDDTSDLEAGISEELKAVRTRVAQGLPLVKRWEVVAEHGEVSAGQRDGFTFLWGLQRGEETRRITVFFSGTAMSVDDEDLPAAVVDAKTTRGRSALRAVVGLDDPPREITVTTAGITLGDSR